MKKFSTISLVLLIALAFFACDEPKDNPKQQTATRTLAHNVGTVTITGYMTNAQWNGVPDAVRDSMNNKINADITQDPSMQTGYKELFDRGVVCIVEENPVGYTVCKLIGDGKTIYVALDKIGLYPGGMLIDLYQSNSTVAN